MYINPHLWIFRQCMGKFLSPMHSLNTKYAVNFALLISYVLNQFLTSFCKIISMSRSPGFLDADLQFKGKPAYFGKKANNMKSQYTEGVLADREVESAWIKEDKMIRKK